MAILKIRKPKTEKSKKMNHPQTKSPSKVKALWEPLPYPKLSQFKFELLSFNSPSLVGNPLNDSSLRHNPVLVPKTEKSSKEVNSASAMSSAKPSSTPSPGLVFVLSGFAGNGTKVLGDRGFDTTLPRQIDGAVQQGKAPSAYYVFVDAWSTWGGSQFLNSKNVGRYEDYIVKDLLPYFKAHLPIDPRKVAVVGHSSGGYGALHLASKHPHHFSFCAAMAPDCFFEASLLPDFYKSASYLKRFTTLDGLKTELVEQRLLRQKVGFQILNCIAMSLCYSSKDLSRKLQWPICLESGLLQTPVWKQWKEHDPLHFLVQRKARLKSLRGLYLEVGTHDEFQLTFGVRQMHQWFLKQRIDHTYDEFNGGHFDSLERFPYVWSWLKQNWNPSA